MAANEIDIISADSEVAASGWHKQDTVWMLGLYGTAIGAGTLFLPIDAGMNGILPLIIMAVLAYPMTYFSHRALCRFVLSGSEPKADITAVVDEYFGASAGNLLTFLYFFAIYPFLLMYSVAITNTTQSFLVNQMGMAPPSRALLALGLILLLMAIIRFGQSIILKSMSVMVYPFIVVFMLLALYLIPHWNGAFFSQSGSMVSSGQGHGLLMSLWLLIPVMVFSFNHSPIISSFAVHHKQKHGNSADDKCRKILKYSHLMMVLTVMFFVFSCVFSLSPQDLALAKQQNISILSYLANHFHTPVIAYVAPFIAFIAIAKSFLGHYLGASEGMHGILVKFLAKRDKSSSRYRLYLVIDLFMIITCWIAATLNPSILRMIETMGGPIIAMILFLMPMYAVAKIPAMQKYRERMSDWFVIIIGMIAISAIIYGLLSW